ncbi:MAG: RAD55 family ATPase [Thermoplasmatota archaeon]
MFQNTIKGLDKIFRTNNYENMNIMVSGYTGTLKSSFTYSLMSKHLDNNPGQIGLYATIEESKDSLLKNLKSIGVKTNDRIFIADYNRTREMYREESENTDFLELTEKLIMSTKEERGEAFTLFTLDSLNALYTLTKIDNDYLIRKRMYYFFKLLRDAGLTSFILKELPRENSFIQKEDENFLADGVIELGIRRTLEGKKRYIEVIKMRQNQHSMKQYIIDIEKDGLTIIGPSVDDMGY